MKYTKLLLQVSLVIGVVVLIAAKANSFTFKKEDTASLPKSPDAEVIPEGTKFAAFGAGCFWCVEEVFQQIPGVIGVVSGYMGGKPENANYKKVSSGRTAHAEIVLIAYDPEAVTFEKLLDVLFASHDPTTLNRQGPDRGPQYRSAVFYQDELQKLATEKKIKELTEAKKFGNRKIVTEVTASSQFHPAEGYHQDFARLNPGHGYLRSQLYPKLKKLGLKIPM